MSRPQFAKRVGLNVKTAGRAGTHRSRSQLGRLVFLIIGLARRVDHPGLAVV
jgi:hypothetical protein